MSDAVASVLYARHIKAYPGYYCTSMHAYIIMELMAMHRLFDVGTIAGCTVSVVTFSRQVELYKRD